MRKNNDRVGNNKKKVNFFYMFYNGKSSFQNQASILKTEPNFVAHKIHLNIKYKQFSPLKLQVALDYLTYGVSVQIYLIKSSSKTENLGSFILASDEDDSLLCLSQYTVTKINYLELKNLSQHILPIPQKLINIKLDSLISVCLLNQEYIIQFENARHKDYFHQAIQHSIIDQTYRLQFQNQLSFFDNQLKNIVGANNEFQLKEVKLILQKLGFELGQEYVKFLFFDEGQKQISLSQFKSKLPILLQKNDVKDIFDKYCQQSKNITDQNTECMTLEEFKNFFHFEQKEEIDQIECEKLFSTNNYNLFSFAQFANILMSQENSIYDEQKLDIYQDMTKPLSHYFISTSRKTLQFEQNYHQFKCLKQYKKHKPYEIPLIFAFECGARYLEVNVWDGSEGEPVCYYGPMMNFQVSLAKVFETIRNHGFKYSEFPIIIGIEDHTQNNDSVMNIIENVLGDYLQKINEGNLQSPSELRRKVLLCRSIIMNTIDEEQEWMIDEEEENEHRVNKNKNFKNLCVNSHLLSTCRLKQQIEEKINKDHEQFTSMKISSQSTFKGGSLKKYHHKHITPDYYFYEIIQGDELFNINSRHVIHQVMDWVIQSQVSGETFQFEQVKKLCEQGQLFKYSPRCKITDNKNTYTTQGFLCQMSLIMVHHHNIDYDYMYYNARFMENGGQYSGYILKPIFDSNKIVKKVQKLHFTIISGNQLNHSKFKEGTNPFVQVILRTPILGREDKIQQQCSKIEFNNSFNPQFSTQCEFQVVDFELSVLLICVYHENCDNLLYWNSFYLPLIREGYRIVPLKDEYLNNKSGTNLFCKIVFE